MKFTVAWAVLPALAVALRNAPPVSNNVLASGDSVFEGLGAETADENETYSQEAVGSQVQSPVQSSGPSSQGNDDASSADQEDTADLQPSQDSVDEEVVNSNAGIASAGAVPSGVASASAGVATPMSGVASSPTPGGVSSQEEGEAGVPSGSGASADVPHSGGSAASVPSVGIKSAGIKSAGIKSAGIKSAGIKSAGVKSAGIKSAGIKSAGVRSGGGVAIPSNAAVFASGGGASAPRSGGIRSAPVGIPILSQGPPPVISQGLVSQHMVSMPPISSLPVTKAKARRSNRLRSTMVSGSAPNAPAIAKVIAPAQHAKPRRNPDGSRLDCGQLLKGRKRMPSVAAFNTLVLALSGRTKGKDPDKMASKALDVLRSTFSQSKQGMDWLTFYDMTDCAVTPDGRTFLMQMIAMGYNAALEEPVAFQLRAGHLRTLIDEDGNNVLHLAVKSGNADVCDKIISVATAEDDQAISMFEARNKAGLLPLDLAKMQKQLDIIRLLQSQFTVLEASREMSQ